jgi:transcriptional regulator with XRE-family HTH domain
MEGKEIVSYLRKRGFEGEELAEALGVSRAAVCYLEKGITKNFGYFYIERAAKALNMKESELIGKLE